VFVRLAVEAPLFLARITPGRRTVHTNATRERGSPRPEPSLARWVGVVALTPGVCATRAGTALGLISTPTVIGHLIQMASGKSAVQAAHFRAL
jgi:hypothetical protein